MKSSSSDAKRARLALGTLVEMRLADLSIAAHAFERAFQAVERVHRLMSRQEADSDVARINRAAANTRVAVDAWTWDVLRRAKELHEATDGLFDCTVAPGGRGSLSDLRLIAGNGVVLSRPLAITLDGIAKGYAVDRAVDALLAAGATAGFVNAGGDLRDLRRGDAADPCAASQLARHIGLDRVRQ
jgi:thiamine biosynthesis lipoprotein